MTYPPDVCDELIEILQYLPRELYQKLPKEVITDLYRNCNSESNFVYNQALPLREQKLLGGTVAALQDFRQNYWSDIDKNTNL